MRKLFLPDQCPACHCRVGGPGLCPSCAVAIDCQLAQPIRFDAGGLAGIAAGPYSDHWRRVVLSFKKDPAQGVERIVRERLLRTLGGLEEMDCRVVVPVPMARVRRRERGWNPAETLAHGLARETGWPVASDLLERGRYAGTLARAGKEERAARLAGAIRSRSGWEPGTVSGREWPVSALLVDDVVTTGATLAACRGPLFEAGFYDVLCLTLARTM